MVTTCWMRRIRIELASKISSTVLVLDDYDDSGKKKNNFNITVSGGKYLSSVKDKGVISVWNLPYDTIAKIMALQCYKITIKIGYQSNGNLDTYFKGEVSYISQKIHSAHDFETYINFASSVVAAYSQSRINFKTNSSINLYAALKFFCEEQGIRQYYISQDLKKVFLSEVMSNYDKTSSIIDSLMSITSGSYNFDESLGNMVNCTTLSDKRYINIDKNMVYINGGNPTVTSSGLNIDVLPFKNLMPGDIIHIDNALLNVSISQADVTSTFNTNYMDSNGDYMIIEMEYNFQNRGSDFKIHILGRALDIIRNITNE